MTTYQELVEIMRKYPQLIFDNWGYEQLSPAIMEANKEGVDAIEAILKREIKGFVRFQNFKPRRSGEAAVRYQVHYNDEGSFTGVAYTDLSKFKTEQDMSPQKGQRRTIVKCDHFHDSYYWARLGTIEFLQKKSTWVRAARRIISYWRKCDPEQKAAELKRSTFFRSFEDSRGHLARSFIRLAALDARRDQRK